MSAPNERATSLRRVHVDGRVDGHHHAAVEQRLQHFLHAHVELVRQILHRHALGERDGAGHRRRRHGRDGRGHALQRVTALPTDCWPPVGRGRNCWPYGGRGPPGMPGAARLRHAGANRLRRQRTRSAHHRGRHAPDRAAGRIGAVAHGRRDAAPVAGGVAGRGGAGRGGGCTERRSGLRHERRRGRRRLARFFDAQSDARRHETSGLARVRRRGVCAAAAGAATARPARRLRAQRQRALALARLRPPARRAAARAPASTGAGS